MNLFETWTYCANNMYSISLHPLSDIDDKVIIPRSFFFYRMGKRGFSCVISCYNTVVNNCHY